MNSTIVQLLCFSLALNCAIAKRISELKCEETLTLPTDPQSLHPHAMEIVKINQMDDVQFEVIPICFGTLISERFVLTSVTCICVASQPGTERIRVRKFKLKEEQYLDSHLFSVRQSIIQHDIFQNNDIGLMQLSEPISYYNAISIFRPACLWTKSTLPLSSNWSIYGNVIYKTADENWDKKVVANPVSILENDKCSTNIHNFSQMHHSGLLDSVCVNSRGRKFTLMLGGAIVTNVINQTYLVAISSDVLYKKGSTVILGGKVSPIIEWIESVVWPNQRNVATFLGCGERKVNHITGEFPWHVALYRTTRNIFKYICGGTIISHRTILTAAQCIKSQHGLLPPVRLIIVAGTHDLNEFTIDARSYGIETIKIHEKYNYSNLGYDIALLTLSGVIEFSDYIQPICISNTLDYNNMPIGVLTGWEYNQSSDILLKATISIHNNDSHCNYLTYSNVHNYCATYQNGAGINCPQDYGSGMIVEYESRWYIRGILSVGADRSDLSHNMMLFTDVPKLFDWIISNLENN